MKTAKIFALPLVLCFTAAAVTACDVVAREMYSDVVEERAALREELSALKKEIYEFDSETGIGIDSMKVIGERIPSGHGFRAFDIYVKKGAESAECIVFGVIFTEQSLDYETTYYRVVIPDGDLSNAHFFNPLDEEEYERLNSSEDEIDRMFAALMMGFHEDFLRSAGEISSGESGWKRLDMWRVELQIGIRGGEVQP